MPDKLFASRHEWIEHDRIHRTKYFCSGDYQQTFARQSDFEDHMQNIHPNTFSKSQLPALVKMCQRTLPSDAEAVCPLCSQRLLTVHPESLSVRSSYQDSIAISVDENIPDTESNPWGTPSAASTRAEGGKAEENRFNPRHHTGRIAPPILENPQANIYNTPDATPGQPYAFPDPENQWSLHLLHLHHHLRFSPGDFVDLKLTEENRQILTMMKLQERPNRYCRSLGVPPRSRRPSSAEEDS